MDLRPALSGKKVSDGGLVGEEGESRKHPGKEEGSGPAAAIGKRQVGDTAVSDW